MDLKFLKQLRDILKKKRYRFEENIFDGSISFKIYSEVVDLNDKSHAIDHLDNVENILKTIFGVEEIKTNEFLYTSNSTKLHIYTTVLSEYTNPVKIIIKNA